MRRNHGLGELESGQCTRCADDRFGGTRLSLDLPGGERSTDVNVSDNGSIVFDDGIGVSDDRVGAEDDGSDHGPAEEGLAVAVRCTGRVRSRFECVF